MNGALIQQPLGYCKGQDHEPRHNATRGWHYGAYNTLRSTNGGGALCAIGGIHDTVYLLCRAATLYSSLRDEVKILLVIEFPHHVL